MRKLFIFLSMVFGIFIGFTFAAPSILNLSHTTHGDNVIINRTDNSDGGYVDINLQDPQTNDWLHFGEVKISDQTFTYTKQWDGDQRIWMIPGDGGDEIKFVIKGKNPASTVTNKKAPSGEQPEVTRTVIPVVPKTGPSGSLIGIILATLAVFGGYIYIRKRADI